MSKVENVRSELISKIKSINNKELLIALNALVASNKTELNEESLSAEQIQMLEMSQEDIKNGKLISQEAMNKRNQEWLNAI